MISLLSRIAEIIVTLVTLVINTITSFVMVSNPVADILYRNVSPLSTDFLFNIFCFLYNPVAVVAVISAPS